MEARTKKRITPSIVTRSAEKNKGDEMSDKTNVDLTRFAIDNSPVKENILEEGRNTYSLPQNTNIQTSTRIQAKLGFLDENIPDLDTYAKTFLVQGYMLPKGAIRTFEYLHHLQQNPYCCPMIGTCNYLKPLRNITKFEMIKALKELLPNDQVVLTLSQQKPPDKLWLEFVFGHKLPNHEVFISDQIEEREVTFNGIEKTIATFGKFKSNNSNKKNRKGLFARMMKKNEKTDAKSIKLNKNLIMLRRRQEKFNEDQRFLKETYEKTLKEFKTIQDSLIAETQANRGQNETSTL